ncbi:MAG: FAD-dependent oxidoreductase [Aeromicrobium erythreum]
MHVVVVGAGLAGLTAAHALLERGADVTVLEGADRAGGKIARGRVGDVVVDLGAESVLARRPEAVDLVRRLGLGDRLVHPVPGGAAIWTRGAVRPLPRTVMGVPCDLDALEESGIVAERPAGRAVPLPAGDVSVRDYLEPRVGSEVVDRLVEPLLGGVYAGHAARLSLRAAAPQLLALGDDPLAAAVATPAPTDGAPVFAGLDGGVALLVETLAERVQESGGTLRLSTTVRSLERRDGAWRVEAGPATAVETFRADAVVVATPAPASARLLAEVAPEAAFALAGVDHASMAITTLVVDGPLPVAGPGFLVPPVDGTTIKASTFSSQKWPWLAERTGGATVLRASVGRAGETAVLHQDDDALVAAVLTDLRAALGELPPVVATHVQRWGGALPQYDVGHADLVATVERDVAAVPGLEVCGAAYHGVGIPAVVASAEAAVGRLSAGGMMTS